MFLPLQRSAIVLSAAWFLLISACQSEAQDSVVRTAAEVDRLVEQELRKSGTTPADLATDEDFLRRVTLDLVGKLPSPAEVILFGLNPDPDKRSELIAELVKSNDYASNWTRYWRDVIFSRATNMRAPLARASFEQWMSERLNENTPWDQIARDMVTATGDVRENGATALIYAHEGQAAEVASETSRIFLGIQIQCANCHDHPWDEWKREQFHELAAFFPRITVRPVRENDRIATYEVVSMNDGRRGRNTPLVSAFAFRRFDRNADGRLQKTEAASTPLAAGFDRLLELADKDRDGALTMPEITSVQLPTMPGRGQLEHAMPDLEHPEAPGTRMQPRFFVTDAGIALGTTDVERRELLAEQLTSPQNPWFARAFVNRIWNELLGEAFYAPVDDLGPARTPRLPEVLDVLSEQFVKSGYDIRWLMQVITNTRTYQRSLARVSNEVQNADLAANIPTRLRSDQLYSSLQQVLGLPENIPGLARRQTAGPYRGARTPRDQFNEIFGFDPSTPNDEKGGSIPQALFLMNSPQVNQAVRAGGNSRVNQLLTQFSDNESAVRELYLQTLVREPGDRELKISLDYIAASPSRAEGFEDLLWSLVNSSEFLLKR